MKLLFSIFLFSCLFLQLPAQNGLERVIVEKYYVSDENDTSVNGDGGELPVNSVTYRVFVDMLPGYIFQAAFGTPGHELRIGTTTKFFNNEDRGARFPTYTRTQAQKNTVMLDSWLSVGAGLKDYFGVLKEKDNGDNTIVNSDGVLQNQHTQAGIPLTEQDGVIAGVTEPVTTVGFSDTNLAIFDDGNDSTAPSILSTHDGAWSSLLGSRGPDTTENIVLLGQFTTDGVFDFELNLQIRNQQTLGVETYVARNPTGGEVLFDGLIHRDSLAINSATRDLVNLNDQISLYPNPTSEFVSVIIDDHVKVMSDHNQYTVRALDGSIVLNGKISDHNTMIDLKNLVPGTYLLSFELDNKYKYVKKIVRIP